MHVVDRGERTGGGSGRDQGGLARIESARVARQMLNQQARVVGLVPAGESGGIQALSQAIAELLHELTGTPVGMVGAFAGWSGFEQTGDFRAEAEYRARPTAPGTDLIALTPQPHGFAAATALERVVPVLAQHYDRVLVDLTGLEKLTGVGALLRAIPSFAIVAAPGRSRRPELLRLAQALPAQRNLGVILYG